ncbi:hypothetical protein [Micromonospora sp. NPDC005324]|uniref:hypothetical protein n=1 Tax=Micromonospora sp. NPDC005324 TaxID=3157033 RepID=UPI0033A331C2
MSDDNPQRRAPRRYTGTTTDFVLDGTTGRLTTATSSGQLTHVDLRVGKHGSTLAGLTEALSTAITTGLQAGAPRPSSWPNYGTPTTPPPAQPPTRTCRTRPR